MGAGNKTTNSITVLKVDKSNWTKIIEGIFLHLKLLKVVSGVPLANVVRQHVKVAHILPGYGTYLDLDEEMIDRDTITDVKSNLKMTKDCLD